MTDHIMPVAQPTPYINTISNIHDWDSLIRFYDLMFDSNPFILFTVAFVGLYGGLVLYEQYNKRKEVKNDDCNKDEISSA